LNGQDAISDLI